MGGMRWGVALLTLVSLTGCGTAPPLADDGSLPRHPLIGTSWLVQNIDDVGVAADIRSTLTFQREDQVIGAGGCNRYFARLALHESSLAISNPGSTRMACPTPAMDQEQHFLEALQAAAGWQRDGETLVLLDAQRRPRLRLIRISGG
jgi:putative lipoprotein